MPQCCSLATTTIPGPKVTRRTEATSAAFSHDAIVERERKENPPECCAQVAFGHIHAAVITFSLPYQPSASGLPIGTAAVLSEHHLETCKKELHCHNIT